MIEAATSRLSRHMQITPEATEHSVTSTLRYES